MDEAIRMKVLDVWVCWYFQERRQWDSSIHIDARWSTRKLQTSHSQSYFEPKQNRRERGETSGWCRNKRVGYLIRWDNFHHPQYHIELLSSAQSWNIQWITDHNNTITQDRVNRHSSDQHPHHSIQREGMNALLLWWMSMVCVQDAVWCMVHGVWCMAITWLQSFLQLV